MYLPCKLFGAKQITTIRFTKGLLDTKRYGIPSCLKRPFFGVVSEENSALLEQVEHNFLRCFYWLKRSKVVQNEAFFDPFSVHLERFGRQ